MSSGGMGGGGGLRPVLPPAVPQFFLTPHDRKGGDVTYTARLLGSAQVHFVDKKSGIDTTDTSRYVTQITDAAIPVDWDDATAADFDESNLVRNPADQDLANASFDPLPPAASKASNYDLWEKDFAAWLARTCCQELFRSAATGDVSKAGESERDFRVRLQQQSRESTDAVKDKIQKSYAAKAAALDEKLRRAEQAVDRESAQAHQQEMQTAISFGATVLGSLLGRRRIGVGTIGRATTAARGVGRAMKESQDVGRAQETVEALKEQLAQLDSELQAELRAEADKHDPLTETFDKVTVRPAKKDITVRLVALVWVPS